VAKSTKPYPREFREGAVRLYKTSGKSLDAIARELGIATESLRNWIRLGDLDSGKRKDGLTTEERHELTALRRKVRVLEQERDILKKATAAFFAQESGSRSR